MYSVTNYYLGKFISSIPFDVLFTVLFSVIVYWMIGFNTTSAGPFFLYFLASLAVTLSAGSLGLLLGCMLPNAEVAVTVAPVVLLPFMLFGGYFANLNNIGKWLSWLQYLSIFKWGFQSLITNELNGLSFGCTSDQYISIQTSNGSLLVCPVTNGTQALGSLGLSYPTDYWEGVGVNFGIFLVVRLLALFFLIYQTKRALKKTQT